MRTRGGRRKSAERNLARQWPTRPQAPSCHKRDTQGCLGEGGHSPNTPTTGLRERGNDTSKSTGCSGRQNAATRRNMQREERVTVQGPVKEQQPDGMSHGGYPLCDMPSRCCVFTGPWTVTRSPLRMSLGGVSCTGGGGGGQYSQFCVSRHPLCTHSGSSLSAVCVQRRYGPARTPSYTEAVDVPSQDHPR